MPSEQTQSFDEQQRELVAYLYSKWYSGPLHALFTSNKYPSVIVGKWANSKKSRGYIHTFVKKYNIDTNEMLHPLSSFRSFNDFFTRRLKPEARPIASDTNAIVSPADGSIVVMQHINENTLYPIKGTTFSTRAVLQDNALAKKFDGGVAFVVRLAPWDYHRIHFPVSGLPSAARIITGRYESVSPAVFQAGVQPLEVNERHILSVQYDKAHMVAVALVGALFVGSIVETYRPKAYYQKGDEMGYFEFGGSTMVLFFQKDTIEVVPEIVAASAKGQEVPVRMGEAIGHVISD